MPTRNVNLTEHFDQFIDKQIKAGQFRNASEVMRAGLRLLEQTSQEDKAKLTLLRALAKEGFDQLDRGEGIMLNGSDELAEFLRNLGTQDEARPSERK